MTKEEAEKEIRHVFKKNWADAIIKALGQEPKTDGDCISRQAIEKLRKYRFSYDINTTIPKSALFVKLADIKELPSVTHTPKKGHWIKISGGCKCPFCDMAFSRLKEDCSDNYCPNCGCRMESEGE